MKPIKTNEKAGRSLATLIFNAYQDYRSNNYPKDPAIYVIRAHPATISRLKVYLKTAVTYIRDSGPTQENHWGFQLKGDPRLEKNTIVFGPETVEIKWTGN